MNKFFFVFLTILCTASSQLLFKWRMSRVPTLPEGGLAKMGALLRLVFSPWIFSALCLGFLGSLFWMAALQRLPLTTAYPLMSLSFVFVYAAGWLLFGESVTTLKTLGMGLIVAGVFCVGRG